MITQSLIYPIPQTKLFSSRILRVSRRAIWIFGFIGLVSLLGLYVFQINQMAKSDYLVESHEQRIKGLSHGNKTLEINFAQANALGNIENLVNNLNFEKAGEVDYIRVIGSTVVAR